jgi:hypothetical protein
VVEQDGVDGPVARLGDPRGIAVLEGDRVVQPAALEVRAGVVEEGRVGSVGVTAPPGGRARAIRHAEWPKPDSGSGADRAPTSPVRSASARPAPGSTVGNPSRSARAVITVGTSSGGGPTRRSSSPTASE